MRKPYLKFSPCNGCAAGGISSRVRGAKEHSENSFFSLRISLGGQTVSLQKREIPSVGLARLQRSFFVLSSHLELAFIPLFHDAFCPLFFLFGFFFSLEAKTLFFFPVTLNDSVAGIRVKKKTNQTQTQQSRWLWGKSSPKISWCC